MLMLLVWGGCVFCLLCCGGYTAVIDAQIAVDIQLLLARRYQMLWLCGLL